MWGEKHTERDHPRSSFQKIKVKKKPVLEMYLPWPLYFMTCRIVEECSGSSHVHGVILQKKKYVHGTSAGLPNKGMAGNVILQEISVLRRE